jgi:hypothetical protein
MYGARKATPRAMFAFTKAGDHSEEMEAGGLACRFSADSGRPFAYFAAGCALNHWIS